MRAYPILLRGQEILAWLDGPFKGTVPRDCRLHVFLHESVSPKPLSILYHYRVVSNFFENSRRYSQLNVHLWCPWHWWQMENKLKLSKFVVHLDLQISPRIFETIWNDPNVIFRGLGEDDSWKKLEAKLSWHVPLKDWTSWRNLCKCKVFMNALFLLYTIYNLGNDFKSFPRIFSP